MNPALGFVTSLREVHSVEERGAQGQVTDTWNFILLH
jgi:hypothetical protein